ncbi:MAG: hypothetical protein ACPG7F_17630 [Aggregatilineales bacterium]
MSQKNQSEAIPTDTLAESENYLVWLSDEPDGETVYHVELGNITLHFFREEWEEVVGLISGAADEARGRRN